MLDANDRRRRCGAGDVRVPAAGVPAVPPGPARRGRAGRVAAAGWTETVDEPEADRAR